MTNDLQAELVKTRALLDAFIRATANVAAQHERFKGRDWSAHPVHPDSLRAISAAYYAAKPEARDFWRVTT